MRLFLALWPTDAERVEVATLQSRIAWPAGAKAVPTEGLHITLHFLGEVEEGRLDDLRSAAAVRAAPVQLTLDRFTVWRGGIAVLEPSIMPLALADLHAALGERLQTAGFELERRPYSAHVTLARRAERAPSQSFEPLTWKANSYVLVQSAGGTYTPIARYPLAAG